MEIGTKELEGLIRYAKAQCEAKCPQERNAEICIRLIELCKVVDVEPPLCYEETDGFSKGFFFAKIREIERRRNKPIEEFLLELKEGGPKTLEDEIDRIDGEFAVEALRAIDSRGAPERKQ
ncbi:MAG: hypothetical protein QFX35_05065 [Candidatus Verstraetearchaeota archaeon]|nr:hypothetical protein [Candidatus Verstraetearchaeota archaeon]